MLIGQQTVLFLIVFGLFDVSIAADKNSCESYFQRKRGSADPGCVKICQTECTNGTCDQQGACNCPRGYENVRNFHYQCARVCPAIDHPENSAYCQSKCQGPSYCDYGTCDDLGRCNCNARFTNNQMNHYLCDPICEPKCRNGHCAPSLKCVCSKGYQIIEPYRNCGKLCDPSNGCGNGECTGNGTCNCHTGFINDGTNVCVPAAPTSVAPVEPGCKPGQTAADGTCEKRCSSDQDCPSESPRCSQDQFCVAGNRSPDDCGNRCKSECEQSCSSTKCASSEVCPCENGSANVETCTTACIRDKCEKGRDASNVASVGIYEMFTGERGVVVVISISVTALLVVLAIVLAVVVRVKNRRRDGESDGDRTPMTDLSYRELMANANDGNSKGDPYSQSRKDNTEARRASQDNQRQGPKDGSRSGQTNEFQERDTYIVPRSMKEEPRYATAQFSSGEGPARVDLRMPGQGGSPESTSYMHMNDLSQEAEEGPMYSNMPNEHDDNIYENYSRKRY